MEKSTSVLNFLVREYQVNKHYDNQFELAASVAKKENWFCSRWQTTGIAIEMYVTRLFYTISVFVIAVLVRPSIEVCSCKFSAAWSDFRKNGLTVLHSIKLLVVLPFIFIGGIFAPQKVYGVVDKALKETNPESAVKLANNEIKRLQTILNRSTEASSRMGRELKEAYRNLAESRSQAQTAAREVTELTRRLGELQSTLARNPVASSLDEASGAIRALVSRVSELTRESEVREVKLRDALASAERVPGLEEQLVVYSRDLIALQKQIALNRQTVEEAVSLRSEIDMLKGQIVEYRDLNKLHSSQLNYYQNALEAYLDEHPEMPYPGLQMLGKAFHRYPFPIELLARDEFTVAEALDHDADYKTSLPWIDGGEHSEDDYDAVGYVAPRVTGLAGIRDGMNAGPNNLNVGLFVRLVGGKLQILVIKTQNTCRYELPEEGREDYSRALYAKAQEGGGCHVEDALDGQDPLFAGTTRSTDHSWDVFGALKIARFFSVAADAIEVEEVAGKSFEWVNLDKALFSRLNIEYKVLVRRYLMPRVDELKGKLGAE
jgi:hypothetical protein